MELREIQDRVIKLEEILTHLAQWTKFDLQKFNTSTTTAAPIFDTDADTDDVNLEADHQDQDHDAEVGQVEVEVEDEIEVDLDLVCKVEVGEDCEDGDDEVHTHTHTWDEEEYKTLVIPMMGEEDCDDLDLELELDLNNQNYSPTQEDARNSSPCAAGFGCGESEPGLESKRKSSRILRRRGHNQHQNPQQSYDNAEMTKTMTPLTPLTPQSQSRREKKKKDENHVRYQCPICPNILLYSGKTDLQKHLKTVHFSKSSCKCPKCPKVFSDLVAIKRHLTQVHTSEKSFICDLCPFATKTQDSLKSHIKHKHNQNTKYSHCYFCQAKFKTCDYFNRHLRQHTGEKPYKCSTCPFSAEELSKLKQHVRIAHTSDPDPGQTLRAIPCPKSNSTMLRTRSTGELTQHAKLHKRIR